MLNISDDKFAKLYKSVNETIVKYDKAIELSDKIIAKGKEVGLEAKSEPQINFEALQKLVMEA